MRTSLIEDISGALFGKTQGILLAFLFGHPDEKFYLRQIARTTGTSVGALQREVKRLSEAGILECTRQGREVFYQANSRSPIFEDLKNLLLKTVGVGDVLRRGLQPIQNRIAVAFVYGSVARGEPRKESDIDILVVGSVTLAEVVATLEESQDLLKREVNPTVYPSAEFRKKLSRKHHFLQSVLKDPKIFLVGGEDELSRLVQERLA